MNFSDDVLKLNPDLGRTRNVQYQAKPERLLLSQSDRFDSDLERAYYVELMARGLEVRLHGWTFHLPGNVDYTPDFVVWDGQGRITVIEVKGSMKQHGARDSRVRFKLASGLYPCFVFLWVMRDVNGKWRETRYIPH